MQVVGHLELRQGKGPINNIEMWMRIEETKVRH